MRPDIAELIAELNEAALHVVDGSASYCEVHRDTLGRVAVILQAVFDPENQPSQFGTKLID